MITSEIIAESYGRLGSVHKVAADLGVSHSVVHRRLTKLALIKTDFYSADDVERLKRDYGEYARQGRLDELAAELGRTKHSLCKKAGFLGLTDIAAAKPWLSARQIGVKRWADKPHPRGALGIVHSTETRKILSEKSRRNWATMKTFGIGIMSPENLQKQSDRQTAFCATVKSSNNYSRTKGGYREDLGDPYFRSSWEANYARYLNLLWKMKIIEKWEYEPETFWFLSIKRGVRSYRPDFLVHYMGEAKPVYVEVKGWMDPKSKTKIARFKKYYPQHRLEVVGQKEYNGIKAKWRSSIPLWEGK